MRRTRKIASVLTVGILALGATACGDDSDSGSDSGGGSAGGGDETTSASSDIKVGMAYDVGGRGDQSFNDSAAAGLDKAKDEFGFDADESEATDGEAESAREERLVTFAEAGYDPIIAVGFAYAESVGKVAAQYPDTHFAIIDDSSLADTPNVASLVFAEEQGSFLVGAAAALKSEAGHIGFVGGVETPLIQKFQAGYEAGAKEVNPDITIDVTYLSQPPDFSGFGDPAKGKTAAEGMYQNGADIVYHAAGGSGGGVFEAAADAGAKAIGVDSDQYNTADPSVQDVIMTSMLKNVDVAVYNYLSEVNDGNFPTGVTTYDLKVDGVGYSTSGGQIDDIVDKLDAYKQQIIDGDITVPTEPAS
ncbi:BMP family ABC transporter substrate-binding protein [Nocardioides anomalus]|uniref:BMP family ABC transporter substrate-binding protein n=1 Tax=Nocardioides anomalus TaxID=2712223 RepID=A0A6G6WG37_9ACTN|nr:BMP family ABC transporter substrate-binding protein [Nocardioides anomalus]QIG44123.1 BMP family ABC transporter substrate-binding protein [Nocardioides anomalus]